MADDDWEYLVALPSRNWGSVSVQKLMDVAVALGAQPSETDITFFQDDEGVLWYAVMVPPKAADAPPSPADGDVGPLDTPLEEFDAAMAAKVELPDARAGPDPLATVMVGEHEVPYAELPLTRYCRRCGREFASKEAARAHEDADHYSPQSLECPDCGWVFAGQRGLKHHASMKHGAGYARPNDPPADPAPSGPPKVQCHDCDFDSLFADDLNTHCLKEHSRRATPLERTPKAVAR